MSLPPSERRFILSLSCPDRLGIVSAVTTFLAQHRIWIIEAQQHADKESNRFFMRYEVLAESCPFGIEQLSEQIAPLRAQFQITGTISDSGRKKRVVILVSKEAHCLDDLLHRYRSGDLVFELQAVISNHNDSRSFVEWHGVPFHHVAVNPQDKEGAFRRIDAIIETSKADVVVLARFMQILPPWICAKHARKIINIHHSFLPSFTGSRPYHQAHERGVKYVGATCHYVTEKLDEGPIIEQDAFRTNHAHSVEQLVRMGRDIEKLVLARGVRYHLEDRVLMNGNKTIVFD
jgi:formyltetrahydrofolate deformylase